MRSKEMGSRELSIFAEQTAVILEAGLPLGDGMETLAEAAAGESHAEQYEQLSRKVNESGSLSEALREDPRPLYIACQGALTDVAAAINRCPEIAERLTVVWIGGAAYPEGGPEFNLMQDVAAARVVFDSKAGLWQLPVTVYGTAEVTMAELAWKVRPCGTMGRYLFDEIEDYNLTNDEPDSLRKGENWSLGDSPAIAALLECDWRPTFHMAQAPFIRDDMRYEPNPEGKEIRLYDYVDIRMLLEDFYAKLALCYRNY